MEEEEEVRRWKKWEVKEGGRSWKEVNDEEVEEEEEEEEKQDEESAKKEEDLGKMEND